jgi:hypothetical protein
MGTSKGNGKYLTPESLWLNFEKYVLHEMDNPMHKIEYVGKDGAMVRTPLETPITFEGFECWLADQGIIQDLGDYVKNKDDRYTDYAPIVSRIQRNCFVHNFKGAAVGIFNPNIIAKKLGLIDRQQHDIKTEQPLFGKE